MGWIREGRVVEWWLLCASVTLGGIDWHYLPPTYLLASTYLFLVC